MSRFLCCCVLSLASPAAAIEIEITEDTTIDESSPFAHYRVTSGMLTVDGTRLLTVSVGTQGKLVFDDGIAINGIGVSGTAVINGDEFRATVGPGQNGTIDIHGGDFLDDFRFHGGTLRIHGGTFHQEITAQDADCCGTIEVYGGNLTYIGSGVVDGFGGAFTFNIHGGNFSGGVSRGYGSGTTINIFGTEFEKTHGWFLNAEGERMWPIVRVTGYLEDGNWFDFSSGGPFRGTEPVNGEFYVLHETFRSILPGDSNDDGSVDLTDLNLVRNNFGSPGEGDIDGSGTVDLEDLNAVRNNFGAVLRRPPATPVPEPATLWLFLGLAIATLSFQVTTYLLQRQE